MRIIPINTDDEGNARCIKADYYKMGLTNFMRQIWGGKNDGFIATGVIEIEDENFEDSPSNEARIH
jgi:hypothetical protein